ncbi:MAG: FKBP-type peptidyl-prolyl cis-trans isomerase [Legionellaceae bacterium]|nr:FKBP-type peptidyl-prolyl cis-trans isomerase [Legionellaceae bacterium]
MKMKYLSVVLLSMNIAPAFANAPMVLSTDADKTSYSIGADLGKNFKKQDISINPGAFQQGLQDSLGEKPLLLTDQQITDTLTKLQKTLMEKQVAMFNKKSEENKQQGEAFLAQNKAKPDVVTLTSGLQYKIVKPGNGAKPSKDDSLTVEYTGKLINGQVFDSTDKTGKPATFKVSQVIPGWTEVLQLMPAGSTWEVYIPSALAYGPRSVGNLIGPNEALVFNIHLLSVNKPEAQVSAKKA